MCPPQYRRRASSAASATARKQGNSSSPSSKRVLSTSVTQELATPRTSETSAHNSLFHRQSSRLSAEEPSSSRSKVSSRSSIPANHASVPSPDAGASTLPTITSIASTQVDGPSYTRNISSTSEASLPHSFDYHSSPSSSQRQQGSSDQSPPLEPTVPQDAETEQSGPSTRILKLKLNPAPPNTKPKSSSALREYKSHLSTLLALADPMSTAELSNPYTSRWVTLDSLCGAYSQLPDHEIGIDNAASNAVGRPDGLKLQNIVKALWYVIENGGSGDVKDLDKLLRGKPHKNDIDESGEESGVSSDGDYDSEEEGRERYGDDQAEGGWDNDIPPPRRSSGWGTASLDEDERVGRTMESTRRREDDEMDRPIPRRGGRGGARGGRGSFGGRGRVRGGRGRGRSARLAPPPRDDDDDDDDDDGWATSGYGGEAFTQEELMFLMSGAVVAPPAADPHPPVSGSANGEGASVNGEGSAADKVVGVEQVEPQMRGQARNGESDDAEREERSLQWE